MWRIVLAGLRVATALYPRSRAMTRVFWGATALLAGFLGYQGYVWLYASKGSLSADQASAVREAVGSALDEFAAKGGGFPARAGIMHLRNDPTDGATRILRHELESRPGWVPVDSSPVKAFLQGIAQTVQDATSADEYLRPGSRVGIDVVFYGTLRDVSTTNGISRAELSLTAYDTRAGRKLVSGVRSAEFPKVSTGLGRSVVRHSRALRIWIFLLFAAALPWIAAPVVHKVREARSNAASALLLAGLLAVDALAGALLFVALSARSVAVSVVLVLCLSYNLLVCEYHAHRS